MEKINIAELLKDCPKGMELDCTIFDNVTFDRVADGGIWIKHIDSQSCEHSLYVYNDGSFPIHNLGSYRTKCVIFPKGKTSWEGFVPPCQFNDGDIVATDSGRWLGIIKNKYDFEYYTVHCAIDYTFNDIFYRCGEYRFSRLATEEEKSKLFDAIKANGYKWNEETKTLERAPKFKVGDRVKSKISQYEYIIEGIRKDVYIMRYKTDKISYHVPFCNEDIYELVPNKFDINTLVPFESKVLVRKDKSSSWKPAIFGCYMENMTIPYCVLGGNCWRYCIPYDGNEHLRGKIHDCDEYFKTWE